MLKQVFHLHRKIGVFLMVNYLILSFTGIILVWDEAHSHGKSSVKAETLAQIQDHVNRKYKDLKILSMMPKEELIEVRLQEKHSIKFKNAKKIYFNKEIEEVSFAKDSNSLMEFVNKLHVNLFMGGYGKLLIGLIGVFCLILVITGIYLKLKLRKYKNDYRKINTHPVLGIFISPWLILVILTGIFLSFNNLVIRHFLLDQINSVKNESIVVEGVDIYTTINTVQKKFSNYRFDFISYPNNEFSLPGSFTILIENNNDQKIIFSNPKTGEIQHIPDFPWYIAFMLISEPLHFGNQWGVFIQILWTFFGIANVWMSILALKLLLKRKKIEINRYSYVR